MSLLIWILILGIGLITIASVIALVQAINSRQINFISHITLTSFAIVFLLGGLGAIGAFFVFTVIDLVFGTLDEAILATGFLATLGGGIVGGGIAGKMGKKKRLACELDPNCTFN